MRPRDLAEASGQLLQGETKHVNSQWFRVLDETGRVQRDLAGPALDDGFGEPLPRDRVEQLVRVSGRGRGPE